MVRMQEQSTVVDEPVAEEQVNDVWERALESIGAFESGTSDTSVEHDRYLADAYLDRLR